MLTWLTSALASTAVRWTIGGIGGALLVGGALLWFNLNFVSRAEMLQWKDRSEKLEAAIEYQKALMEQYDSQRKEAEGKVEDLEKQNDEQTAKERQGDNPVLLDRGDVERLRQFQGRSK